MGYDLQFGKGKEKDEVRSCTEMPGTGPGTYCAFVAVTVTLLLFYVLLLTLFFQKSLQPGRDDVLTTGQRLVMYAPK